MLVTAACDLMRPNWGIEVADPTMPEVVDNIVKFPLARRRELKSCPHCGCHSDVWKIGRLLWAYCDRHEVRWVVADYKTVTPETLDRAHLRRGLEFLSNFSEVMS